VSASIYQLPIPKDWAYGLASMCAAAYVKKDLRLDATGNVVTASLSEVVDGIRDKLKRGFDPLKWSIPSQTEFELLAHHQKTRKKVRLAGYTLATRDYMAVVFRGTAYSDEWLANASLALPAVRNRRQLFGLTLLSLIPKLKKSKRLQRIFDMENGANENAAYVRHLLGIVKQVKRFLDKAIGQENADPSLRGRPLYITGHSLGGAASIVTRKRLLHSKQTQYAKGFGSRTITVTFGAPPLLAKVEFPLPGGPPVYNIVRPNDIVPCLSLDLIGIPLLSRTGFVPRLPATPFHFGEHYLLRANKKVVDVAKHSIKHRSVFGLASLQFLSGALRLRAFRQVISCHGMASYAKDMERVAF
jgi:lipase (class 3)